MYSNAGNATERRGYGISQKFFICKKKMKNNNKCGCILLAHILVVFNTPISVLVCLHVFPSSDEK